MQTPDRPSQGCTEPHASATRSAVDSGRPRGGLVQRVTERLEAAEKTIAQLRKKLSKERKRRSNFQHKYKTLQNSCNFERKQLGVQRKTESEPSALNLNRIESLSLPKLQQLQQLKETIEESIMETAGRARAKEKRRQLFHWARRPRLQFGAWNCVRARVLHSLKPADGNKLVMLSPGNILKSALAA